MFDGIDLVIAAILGGGLVAVVIGRGISDLRSAFNELRQENTRLQCRVEALERESAAKDQIIADLRTDLMIWKARVLDTEKKVLNDADRQS